MAQASVSALFLALSFAAPTTQAVLANDGSAIAIRQTSTAGLSISELQLYARLGEFRGFLGTPIDSSHFITAQHIGIVPTDTIRFGPGPNAGTYTIQSWIDDPSSDLRIVKVNGSFTAWVPLNGSGYELNRTATIFGRGGPPLSQIVVGSELKGWSAAAPDGQISWGRNVVVGTIAPNQIYARFEQRGLPLEAGLTTGDSGGPWFAPDGQGFFRLIGVTFGTTGPYQQNIAGSPSGVTFEAALFDIGGLWVGRVESAVYIPENPVNVAALTVATRISDRIAWITSQIGIVASDADFDGVTDQFDNCPWISNASQTDSGGLGFGTTPDGIGDACQCGDVTGEGQVNDTDAAFIKRQALGLSAPLFVVPNNCDVSGDGGCSGVDATLIRHAAAGSPVPMFGQNCRNALP